MTPRAPDWFVRRLRQIDRELRVEWLPREQKWAILQVLWNTPSIETTTARLATEAYPKFLAQGHVVPRPMLEAALYATVSKEAIVLRVEYPDGRPRELDGWALGELERRAFKRRNWGLKDWVSAMDDLDYQARRQRERAEADIWSHSSNDKVFTRIMSDTLAGLKMRHTIGGPLPETATKERPLCSS